MIRRRSHRAHGRGKRHAGGGARDHPALPAQIAASSDGPCRSGSRTAASQDDPRLARNEVHVIASAARSLERAAALAQSRGIAAAILSDAIEGEAREVAKVHAAIAREVALRGRPFAAPVVLLSGGETDRHHPRQGGRGGRNSEFLLSLAFGIEGLDRVHALAADTDGIDGSETNAGAFADGRTIARLREAGLDPAGLSTQTIPGRPSMRWRLCSRPGPTGTNVNDFRAILIA